MGESFTMLLIARAIEGIGSSCINVCGMSYIALLYPDDQQRSKVMGIILGSIAGGVLCGYPLGGLLYDFVSESCPFIIISAFLFTDLALQLTFFDLTHNETVMWCESALKILKINKIQPSLFLSLIYIFLCSVKSMVKKIE
jgi:DHA1 family solute carrier family 18 vesicular amine transporter 1/2